MIIEIYKSALCPRCAYALLSLKKLENEFDDIQIITYDVFTNINAFKKSGIKMIPSIKINENIKSWIIPNASEIKEFILENR